MKFRPGQIAAISGQYGLYDNFGNFQQVEVTVTKGEPFPPTPFAGMYYQLRDKTIHKSDK